MITYNYLLLIIITNLMIFYMFLLLCFFYNNVFLIFIQYLYIKYLKIYINRINQNEEITNNIFFRKMN